MNDDVLFETRPSRPDPFTRRWAPADAADLYHVDAWAQGYFAVDPEGRLVVRPSGSQALEISLPEVVDALREEGLETPVLLCFNDILDHRLDVIHEAFATAIEENGFDGGYLSVYPIKVNQQRPTVEQALRSGARHGSGLEVGSKPELLAAIALTAAAPDRMILCNGFKDDAYLETVILASKLGRNILAIVEKPTDFALILKHADRHDVKPRFGVRIKLATQGAGRWRDSSGERSKFGLSTSEVIDLFDELQALGLSRALELVHCHPGSQVQDIRRLKDAVGEIAHVYCELVEMGADPRYIDVGGGLGVDYDGSGTNFASSMNYTLREYANEVIYRIGSVCDERGVSHPTVITESGRASAAFHSVLIVSVLGASGPGGLQIRDSDLEPVVADEGVVAPVRDLLLAYQSIEARSLMECYHDAIQAREQALNLFSLGYLSLSDRGRVERLFWGTCRRVLAVAGELEPRPEELASLIDAMSETYICNFSVFQSLPDSWAIGQLFPILPIRRLDERPTRRVTLADLTCDSDGRIDRFVDGRAVKRTLELHELIPGEAYDIAVCLVGAYQETLGAMHNLFGDPHSVHIGTDPNGDWFVEEIVHGDSARDVLGFSRYDTDRLVGSISEDCELAAGEGRITATEGKRIIDGYAAELDGYTYLRRPQTS